jgi:diguanylate cyclase (GGDEF)-like protein
MAISFTEAVERDPMTQLAPRMVFERDLAAAVSAAQEDATSVSVAVLDVDLFGQLNAAQGRAAGDAALARLAECLRAALAESGAAVYRIGGDGFGVVLPGVDKEQAFLYLERFRNEAAAGAGPTVSIGVASFPDDAPRHNEVFIKACEALYRAKVSGRNKACLAREEKMVTKTSHYTQGQLLGLRRLAEREGIGEAVLLREALNDLLRKHNA